MTRALAVVVALVVGSCAVVRYIRGPQLTGTCAGACEHYLDCRGERDDTAAVRAACVAECPQVFADRDSLMTFESLSCPATVDYVEGPARRPPGSPSR